MTNPFSFAIGSMSGEECPECLGRRAAFHAIEEIRELCADYGVELGSIEPAASSLADALRTATRHVQIVADGRFCARHRSESDQD